MQFKTHLLTSLTVSLPILSQVNILNSASIAGLCVGTLLPDVDEPNSYIGRKTIFLSSIIKTLFRHRGITHSLFSITILGICLYFFFSPFLLGLTLGYALHIIEDSFSVSGVRWLLPFSNKPYRYKSTWLTYKTGGLKEYLILITMVTILARQLKMDDYNHLIRHFIAQTEIGWQTISNSLFFK